MLHGRKSFMCSTKTTLDKWEIYYKQTVIKTSTVLNSIKNRSNYKISRMF